MKYLYYNREEVDSFEKCTHPSGCETKTPTLELCFDDDQDFMIDFIRKFREKVDRNLHIDAHFGRKDSGPEGENSYVTIPVRTEEEWKLAFETIEDFIKEYNDCVDEILIENY